MKNIRIQPSTKFSKMRESAQLEEMGRIIEQLENSGTAFDKAYLEYQQASINWQRGDE